MSYSPRTRDRYRLLVTALTGTTAAAAIAGTGWVAGAVAHSQDQAAAQQQAEQDAAQAKAARPQAATRHG